MSTVLKSHRGNSTYMASTGASVVLQEGEIFVEYQTSGGPKIKVGDGTTTYANLPYITAEDVSKSKMKKTRYTISASNWSNSANADGYYTYTISLNPSLSLNYAPEVYLTGADDNTFYTSTEETQFKLIKHCNLTAVNSLTLYATDKPDSNFYVFVKGELA